jgi:hypothetical protein
MSTNTHEIGMWISQNWWWVLILFWVFGGGIAESWRRMIRNRRQHQINMAYARRGLPPPRQIVVYRDPDDEGWDEGDAEDWDEDDEDQKVVVPAAVQPTPPGAKPVRVVPGPCQHESVVPVINDEGYLEKWICKNYPRCTAEFDRSIAMYAGDLKNEAGQ